MKTTNDTRRHFLQTAAAGAASLAAVPYVIAGDGVKGANERIGVGFIGAGGRAEAHIGHCLALKAQGRCQPVAVCDIYGPRVRAAARRTGGKIYHRHQDLLADPRVDVVCIATPDRHHAPQAINAVRAGKDVYCEKPLTHWTQFDLAKQLGEEAKKHKRVVQVGTQYVADDAYDQAKKLIAQGIVGKIVHIQVGYFRRGDWGERMPVPDAKATPGPDLDWQQFLGDAPQRPFDVSRFFQWRLYWDYAGGPATDLLVHAFTPAFRLLEVDFPERVLGGGGNFQYDREVPDQCNIIADYKGGPSVVLMNSLSNFTGINTILRGTDGSILFGDIEHFGSGIRLVPLKGKEVVVPWHSAGDRTPQLWSNFIDCVHSRQRPFSAIEVAVRVQAPLIMGILSHRENKVARFDTAKQQIVL
jgi:predicted dehydrogenase